MKTEELDFELPAELIAQVPSEKRGDSRLLHYQRATGAIEHRMFKELPGLLRRGDLLVFNDARVIPARFTLKKKSGGRIEGLFIKEVRPSRWYVMLKGLGMDNPGLVFEERPDIWAMPIRYGPPEYEIDVGTDLSAVELLSQIGRMPLPPYIQRGKHRDDRDESDRERYQTVYSKEPGAIAAPTAGLHFTEDILVKLQNAGVDKTFVTLHVGMGTFKPVSADDLSQHAMHSESYSIDTAAAETLNRAKHEHRRIIAVGTTAARVLESQPENEPFTARSGETSIFIYPPYRWKHVDALITNFHLPRSTLIALVAAMVSLDEQRRIYQAAIAERYRFFSYGDAMFID
jgi:S-adenosylmethionine:tRNA ribosyltransferase-isomerase